MLLCRVVGSATSTIRHPSLKGWRLLLCQPLGAGGRADGPPILCLDNLGAAPSQAVVVSSDGRSVREKVGDPYSPARYMTIALVDEGQPAGGAPA